MKFIIEMTEEIEEDSTPSQNLRQKLSREGPAFSKKLLTEKGFSNSLPKNVSSGGSAGIHHANQLEIYNKTTKNLKFIKDIGAFSRCSLEELFVEKPPHNESPEVKSLKKTKTPFSRHSPDEPVEGSNSISSLSRKSGAEARHRNTSLSNRVLQAKEESSIETIPSLLGFREVIHKLFDVKERPKDVADSGAVHLKWLGLMKAAHRSSHSIHGVKVRNLARSKLDS